MCSGLSGGVEACGFCPPREDTDRRATQRETYKAHVTLTGVLALSGDNRGHCGFYSSLFIEKERERETARC